MKRISLILLLLLAVAALVAGCTTPQSPAPVATPVPAAETSPVPAAPLVPAGLADDWTLTTMGIQNGTAVINPTYGITLTFNSDGSLTGYDGCNNYFGSFTLTGITTPKGEGMTVSNLGSTKMFCAPLANQEQQYLYILSNTAAYDAGTTELTLTADTMDVLVYQRTDTLSTPP
ncbi:MAG: META domain-containing protein [Methanoregula sp.]|jgi:heat shock protein HslJ|nr:META domain-containing protein [Methanoregula sp.]